MLRYKKSQDRKGEGIMRTSEAFWEVFKATGHIGAYLLYKHYDIGELESEMAAGEYSEGLEVAVQE